MDPAVGLNILILLIVLGIFAFGLRRVPADRKGAKTDRDKNPVDLPSGWHIINPLTTQFRTVDATDQILDLSENTVLSADGVPVRPNGYITWAVVDASRVIFGVPQVERILERMVMEALQTITHHHTSTKLVHDRDVLDEIKSDLHKAMKAVEERLGIEIKESGLESFRLPPELELANIKLAAAEQDALAMEIRAGGEAKATLIERGAEEDGWIPKTFADTLLEVGLAIAAAMKR